MTAILDPAAAVVDGLTRRGETLATAESLTGGLLAGAVTGVPGASAVFRGGVVAYATELKMRLLDVPRATVADHGVVSAETAQAMAVGARALLQATYALSTTGVAGPDPQDGRPVGTVFVALASDGRVQVEALRLTGGRAEIREETCRAALRLLLSTLG